MTVLIVAGLLALTAIGLAAAAWLADRPEPRHAAPRQPRGDDAGDDRWVTILRAARARVVPPAAVARARLAGWTAALALARDGEPRCPACRHRAGALCGCPCCAPLDRAAWLQPRWADATGTFTAITRDQPW